MSSLGSSASESASPPVPPETADRPRLEWVEPSRIQTRLRGLRGPRGPSMVSTQELSPIPLRVVATESGDYELLDGFKRLARWLQLGLSRVPVMVERSRSSVEQKVALLEANRPPRTLSPMDEARVVRDLRRTEQLGPATIAKVCGRKRRWVLQRLTLAEELCESLQQRLDEGGLGVTLAHALCALADAEQQAVVGAADRHGLKGQEALSLLSAFRVAETPAERRQLLDDPLKVVRPPTRSASPLGALATRLEARLDRVRDALETIADFQLPEDGLSPAERRRLEAGHRAVLLQLMHTAPGLAAEHLGITGHQEDHHDRVETETEPPEPGEGPAADGGGDPSRNGGGNADPGAGGDPHPEAPKEGQEDGGPHRGAAHGDQAAWRDQARRPHDRPEARPRSQAGAQRARPARSGSDPRSGAEDALRGRRQT